MLCRFGALATESDRWHFASSDDGRESWVAFTNQAAELHPFFDVRFFAEMYLTQCVHFAGALTQKLAKPLRVEFSHAAPPDDGLQKNYLSYYQQTFNAPVHFNCSSNRIFFASDLLDVPLARPDTNLGQLLSYEADKRLNVLHEQNTSTKTSFGPTLTSASTVQSDAQVRGILEAAIRLLTVGSIDAGGLSLENIAKELKVPTI